MKPVRLPALKDPVFIVDPLGGLIPGEYAGRCNVRPEWAKVRLLDRPTSRWDRYRSVPFSDLTPGTLDNAKAIREVTLANERALAAVVAARAAQLDLPRYAYPQPYRPRSA